MSWWPAQAPSGSSDRRSPSEITPVSEVTSRTSAGEKYGRSFSRNTVSAPHVPVLLARTTRSSSA
ncbi:hypothetical protein CF166_00535 [Amycolatopsis sp. KNN50.9b]|nr:hypothetical protein CF166_00535 [Amycolatopsis sp. KNN50.9b]